MPASSPFTGAEVRFFRSMRWISWLRYQPYPAAAPAISTRTSASVPPTQAAVRLRERRFGAAWAGPCRPSSSSALLALRRPRPPVRVASSIWRPSSWRPFSTGFSAAFLRRVRLHRPSVDLLTELVEALLDGIVLGLWRTHRAVFRLKTCDRTLRPTPVSPRWLRLGPPERDVSLASVAADRQSRFPQGRRVDRPSPAALCNPGCGKSHG